MKYGIWDMKGKYWTYEICKEPLIFFTSNINIAFQYINTCDDYYAKFDKNLEVRVMEKV